MANNSVRHFLTKKCLTPFLWLAVSLSATVQAEPASSYRESEPLRQGGWSRVVKGGFGDPGIELIGRLVEFKGYFYAATDHKTGGCQIWRSLNGTDWQIVVGPGAVMPAGFKNPPNPSINELLAFGDWLFAGTWNQEQGAELWRSADGLIWEPVVGGGSATLSGFGKHENSGITALGGFRGMLFAGTGSLYCKDGVELWRSKDAGSTWNPVAGERIALRTEMARESKYFLDLAEFKDALYISTGDQRTGGSEIWSTQDGETWKTVVGPPSPYRAGMGNSNDDMIYDLEPFNGSLYAGVLNYVHDGGALWRSVDGTTWEVISGDPPAPIAPGFGDAGNMGLVSLAVFDGALYVGTTNNAGTQLWRSVDGATWQPVVGQAAAVPAGFGNVHNRAINSLGVFHDALYAGAHNPTEGAELWRFETPAQPN